MRRAPQFDDLVSRIVEGRSTLLRDDRDLLGEALAAPGFHLAPVEEHGPDTGFEGTGHRAEQGAFATAVRAYDGEKGTFQKFQRNAVQLVVGAVADPDAVDGELYLRGHACGSGGGGRERMVRHRGR